MCASEVEGVDHGQDAGGEVADATAELVVAGQLLALRGEGLAAFGEVAVLTEGTSLRLAEATAGKGVIPLT